MKMLSYLSPFSFILKIMTTALKHYLNPLHIYCRLVKILPKRQAWGIISLWERTRLYALMYA